jgi:uncharacterized protein (DUF1501 family)
MPTTPANAKVLVVVVLAGANDFINTFMDLSPAQMERLNRPFPNTGQPQNTKGRGIYALEPPSSSQVGKALALGSSGFACHPKLTKFPVIYNAGDLALVNGVGNLVRTLTKQQLIDNFYDPAWVVTQLGDHFAQEYHLGTGEGTLERIQGWGGQAAITGEPFAVVSFGGSERFGQSTLGSEISLPLPNTPFGRNNLQSGLPIRDSRRVMVDGILSTPRTNLLTNAYRSRMQKAVVTSNNLAGLLNEPIGSPNLPAAINTAFAGVSDRLGQQLFQCAKIVANMDLLNAEKLILYCRLDAFDLHVGQFSAQGNKNGGALQGGHADLLGQVNSAMGGFYDAMVGLGQNNKVVQTAISEFGRTFLPNASPQVGTEHAHATSFWAIGGPVNGGVYGRYPILEANGPDDTGSPIDSQGRFLPDISHTQYFNTLLQWWNPGMDMTNVLRNIGRFSPQNLGFLQA